MAEATATDSSPISDEHQHSAYRIALYYCYIPIDDTAEHVKFQKELCTSLNCKGRIRVSSEGLNGVLSGYYSDLQRYQKETEQELSLEKKLDVKYCDLRTDLSVDSQLFTNLSVKVTREVVSLYEPTAKEMARTPGIANEDSKKYYRRRRRNRKKHEQQQQPNTEAEQQDAVPKSPNDARLEQLQPSPHLTPQQWHEKILQLSNNGSNNDIVLLDARNSYESRVGYFQVDGVPTLLTNTRKYSSLPQVLQTSQDQLAGKHVFMYCTGGVRCERASVHLQAMEWNEGASPPPKGIYQLDGGIQRYLEQYGTKQLLEQEQRSAEENSSCLFKGKNFVFDPRRTDPRVGEGVVGRCVRCHTPHDDYDNGASPSQEQEARCVKCRVLVLVCPNCRSRVQSWGEEENEDKPPLWCGKDDECVQDSNDAAQAEMLLHDGGGVDR